MKHKVPLITSFSYSPYVVQVRNTIIGSDVPLFNDIFDYTHILWIDSDIEYSVYDFVKLLEHDKDIVGASYMMGKGEYCACTNFSEGGFMMSEEEFHAHKELFEVAWNGFGFMLIKKGVFEKLGRPWFMPRTDSTGRYLGEDVSFCVTAREHGYKVWCDPSISLSHHKIVPLHKGPRQQDIKVTEFKRKKKEETGARELTGSTDRDNKQVPC